MHFLIETIRLGLANLRNHLLRSILTALGIILGVAAVITMTSLGEGSKRQALAQLERLGAKNLIVRSQRPPETANQNNQQQRGFVSRYGVTRDTLELIRENFADAEAIVPLKEVGGQVVRNERRKTSQSYGTTPEFASVARLAVARGRYLTPADMDERATVCVIGSEMEKEFFPFEDALGETLRIDDRAFKVVGVLAPVGLAGGAGSALIGRDLNLDVHIPWTTARGAFGDLVSRRSSGSFQANEVQVSEIYLAAPTRDRVLEDASRLRRLLDVRHPGLTDVGLIVPYELLEQAERTAATYNAVFGSIAGISLLVGGIGIMNIMLASVTERTREIGIRRAIGATRKHILAQFLVETSVLSMIGGLLGVGLGLGASVLLGMLGENLDVVRRLGVVIPSDLTIPTRVSPWSIIVAFAVATATGLVFGIYPARRAAAQDPIVALRHD